MNKLTKLLVLVLFVVLGITLVGCTEPEPEPEPEKIAPTAITVDATIYSGSETEKYVVVGSKMYIEAMVEGPEGADETVEWSIDGDAATLSVEDGAAVVTGVKGGNATVTAKAALDANVKGSYVVEVVESEDFNEVVVLAKDEVVSKLPEYATADFTLPQPSNPNVKLTYMSKLKKTWADGVFKFADAYNAQNGDSLYVFYGTFQFHGVKKEFEFSIKCVGDLKNNDFYALSAAKAQVEAIFAESKIISSSFKDIIDNANGTYTLELPVEITVEGYSQPITIEWQVYHPDEEGKYVGKGLEIKSKSKLVYTKPLVDSECQINALYKAKNNSDISKIFVVAVGYTPDEVWEYFKTNNYKASYYNAATDTFSLSTAGFSAPTIDNSKKFKDLTVEYEVLAESADLLGYTYKEGNTTGTFRKLGTGEAKVKVTLYFAKGIRKVLVDKFDENGNLVKDEEGKVVQEEQEKIECLWSQEYEITITLK